MNIPKEKEGTLDVSEYAELDDTSEYEETNDTFVLTPELYAQIKERNRLEYIEMQKKIELYYKMKRMYTLNEGVQLSETDLCSFATSAPWIDKPCEPDQFQCNLFHYWDRALVDTLRQIAIGKTARVKNKDRRKYCIRELNTLRYGLVYTDPVTREIVGFCIWKHYDDCNDEDGVVQRRINLFIYCIKANPRTLCDQLISNLIQYCTDNNVEFIKIIDGPLNIETYCQRYACIIDPEDIKYHIIEIYKDIPSEHRHHRAYTYSKNRRKYDTKDYPEFGECVLDWSRPTESTALTRSPKINRLVNIEW